MARFDFISQGYEGVSTAFESSRTINFYPELAPDTDCKSVVALLGTPGLALYTTVGDGPVRGIHTFNGVNYVVSGGGLYSVDSSKNVTFLGSLQTSSGTVLMEDNGITANGAGGNQLIVVDGVAGYICDIGGAFSTIPNTGGFPLNPKGLTYIDGYFVVTNGTMSYWVSDLYDGLTWSALATSPVSATPDNIQCPINCQQQLYFVKKFTTEAWYDAGVPTTQGSPYSRVSGAVSGYGTRAPHSVCRVGNGFVFLASQWVKGGETFIGPAMMVGYTPSVIAPPSIIYKMSKWTDIENVFAYCYSDSGHTFAVFTSPGDNQTFVYDTTTTFWHERSFYSDDPFQTNRHVSNCYACYNGMHLVGDYRNGNVYNMSSAYYTDFGNPIISIRVSPHIFDRDSLDYVFVHRLILDAEMGVGTDGPTNPATAHCDIIGGAVNHIYVDSGGCDYVSAPSVTFESVDGNGIGATATATVVDGSITTIAVVSGGSGYTAAPRVVFSGPVVESSAALSWSNDGGKTYSGEYSASLGDVGEYKKQLRWRRLGLAKNRVFRLRISDPCKKVLFNGYVEAGE